MMTFLDEALFSTDVTSLRLDYWEV